MVLKKMMFVVWELNGKRKKEENKRRVLNLILGRKYKGGIRHFQAAEFNTVSGRP